MAQITAAQTFSTDLLDQLRAEQLPVGLRQQILRPCRGPAQNDLIILILDSGALRLEGFSDDPNTAQELTGQAAAILAPSAELALKIAPGSEGWIFGLPPQTLGDIIGNRPELEAMLPRKGQAIFAPQPMPGAIALDILAQSILTEHRQPSLGSRIAIRAHLWLMILTIWRSTHQENRLQDYGGDSEILENFRREVEIHFRNHLSIADYAARLGLSQTRLRRLCLRRLNRSPLQLVHMRLLREAAEWLEHSVKSIAEIGFALGFGDATEFSHFFKRGTGLSPKAYRASRSSIAEAESQNLACFADWP